MRKFFWSAVVLMLVTVVGNAAPPIRIMPVGDSITCGSNVAGGYRLELYRLLTAAGYNVDFVGTQASACYTNALPDADHEGHSGWRIDQIDSIIVGVFNQIADPDILLLLIGTNDFGQGYDITNAIHRLNALVGKMATNRPFCKIIVANLLERGEPQNSQITNLFNPFVPGLVASNAALGREVYFDDLRSDVPLADMPDKLHPNATGYAKMATNWFNVITSHFSPEGSTNAPAIAHAYGSANLTNLLITFSKPVADSATNISCYSLDGGLVVLGASLDATTKRDLTLTTTRQTPGIAYTVTINGVVDRTAAATPIASNSTATITAFGPGERGAFTNVAESSDYTLVYSLDIPTNANYSSGPVPYNVDLRAYAGAYDRIAYYLELQPTNGPISFCWVSMDPFTTNINLIGVPCTNSGAFFQQTVSNLNVFCNVSNVTSGVGLGEGYLEFWPCNYNQSNVAAVANASNSYYDWGDNPTPGNYGSMQVHRPSASQVLFAFNRWGGNGSPVDIGIGNRPGSLDADWTFAYNAGSYAIKTLQVFVRPVSNAAPVLLSANGLNGWTNIVLNFSKPLSDDATNLAHYALSGGLAVLDATLDPVTKVSVTLTTSPQRPSATYTVTVNGLCDRTTNQTLIASNSTVAFTTAPTHGARNNVAEAADYTLVYSLDIPNTANYNSTGLVYNVDARNLVGPYSRIAYYLELQPPSGDIQYIWVSTDAFTSDINKIGVPYYGTAASFQQYLTNMNVFSSVSGIVTGTNISTGNIEFWPGSYDASNIMLIANASNTLYDWGDRPTSSSGYGSMQIHNYAAVTPTGTGQVLFAFNHWGNAGTSILDLGIGNRATGNPDYTFAANANSYSNKLLQVYVLPLPDTAAPTLLSALASPDLIHITLRFSERLADSSANPANFSLSGGLTVLSVTLSADKREILLTTTPRTPGTSYTVTVNNVRDRSSNANSIAPDTTLPVTPVPAQVLANAPETADFQLVYALDIPSASPSWNINGTPYNIDNRWHIGAFDRIAYYLELVTTTGATNWIYVAMDPFTTDVHKIGVPDMIAGGVFQKAVSNLTVYSNVSGITTGTTFTAGNIEFWPFDYSATTNSSVVVTNASNSLFDWGDTITYTTGTSGYGSMQVHNPYASQVLFALNRWGGNQSGNIVCVGIGNNPSGNPDWTHSSSATNYTSRTLYVMVHPANDTNAPTILSAAGDGNRTNIMVTFNEPVADTAGNPANFTINNGINVLSASLQPNLRQVLLTTDPRTFGTPYTLTVNNIRDRSPNANLIATNSTITITDPIAYTLVSESTNYTLVHTLALPGAVPNYNVNGVPYGVDQSRFLTQRFDRIAYYIELATNAVTGPTNWLYVSMDAFTTNITRVGVPVLANGAYFYAQILTNMNVFSSVSDIVTGTSIATGNIEFSPWNYGAATNSAIPTGSNSLYDWNDTPSTSGQYGSMQIHNYGAITATGTGQVLFAFNKWGGGQTGNADLGIGNGTGANPDWTFLNNAATYAVKNLHVFVRRIATTPPPAASAPFIAAPPQSDTNYVGDATILSVNAGGTDPLTYQWRHNGVPLDGETNSWIAFTNLTLCHAGSYDVIVSNTAGAVTSDAATLFLIDTTPPVIVSYTAVTNLFADANGQARLPNLAALLTASEPCGSYNVTQAPVYNTLLGIGSHNVQLTVTDLSGNTNNALATVNVVDVRTFQVREIAAQSNNIVVTWDLVQGVTNIVQATPEGWRGGFTNNFHDISPPFFVPGTGTIRTNYLDIGGATNGPGRFYRIRLVP